jgi:hypothetical protein
MFYLLIYLFIIVAKFSLIFVDHQASSSINVSAPFLNITNNEEFHVHSNPSETSLTLKSSYGSLIILFVFCMQP